MPDMTWNNIPAQPKEQLQAWAPALDYIKDLCVKLGLVFVEQQATYSTARRFYVYYGKTCLVAADDPMQIEHYLYGWRDARTIPLPGADEAANALLEAEHAAKDVLKWIDKLDEFVDPLTRERA